MQINLFCYRIRVNILCKIENLSFLEKYPSVNYVHVVISYNFLSFVGEMDSHDLYHCVCAFRWAMFYSNKMVDLF